MELVLIGVVALLTSGLTLFSGFGLGTILMPVFALFFPLTLAIAATAVVHFANNLFKFGLMARQADWPVVARFSLPAAIAAILGAASLTFFDQLPTLWHHTIAGSSFEITAVKAVIGSLIVLFALLELSPRFQALAFPPRWLPVGGGALGVLRGTIGKSRCAAFGVSVESGLVQRGVRGDGGCLRRDRRCHSPHGLRHRHACRSIFTGSDTRTARCRGDDLRVHRCFRGQARLAEGHSLFARFSSSSP
ncbi:MAG: sulfite exporter TauE/SafE family protein [Gammaproteobacteria bacterium]